jgi:hypothetical protein
MTMYESVSYNPKSLGVLFCGNPSTDWILKLPFHEKIVVITEMRECEKWSELSPEVQHIIEKNDKTLAFGMQQYEARPPATIE